MVAYMGDNEAVYEKIMTLKSDLFNLNDALEFCGF